MKHIHERDLLKRWEEIADLLPKFAKVNIGIDYIELMLFYKTYAMRKKMVNYVEYNLPKLRYIERLMA